jgi:Fur family zinc uptake transcriptional regulator
MSEKHDLTNVLQTAKALCDEQGVKLTPKRQSVLEVLLKGQEPLTAYELADRVSHYTKQLTKPMSIYRILDFLVGQHLVHRLNMTNKYVACNKIRCCQEHGLSQFLICSKCERVQEVTMPEEMYNGFMQQLTNAGCTFKESHIELEVVCNRCQVNESMTHSHHKEENDYANSIC